jgi:hypothetical protein
MVELPGVLPLHHRETIHRPDLNRRCQIIENPQSMAR